MNPRDFRQVARILRNFRCAEQIMFRAIEDLANGILGHSDIPFDWDAVKIRIERVGDYLKVELSNGFPDGIAPK